MTSANRILFFYFYSFNFSNWNTTISADVVVKMLFLIVSCFTIKCETKREKEEWKKEKTFQIFEHIFVGVAVTVVVIETTDFILKW